MKKRTGKLRCCSYQQTYKNKLRDLTESRKADEVLIKHYTFILENRDDIVAKRNEKIAKAEKEKTEFLEEVAKAPERLMQLNAHLAEMIKKIGDTKDAATGKKQRIKRIKSLRERLAALQQECEAEGIDVEQAVKDLNEEI